MLVLFGANQRDERVFGNEVDFISVFDQISAEPGLRQLLIPGSVAVPVVSFRGLISSGAADIEYRGKVFLNHAEVNDQFEGRFAIADLDRSQRGLERSL